jgi:hypothetical protein
MGRKENKYSYHNRMIMESQRSIRAIAIMMLLITGMIVTSISSVIIWRKISGLVAIKQAAEERTTIGEDLPQVETPVRHLALWLLTLILIFTLCTVLLIAVILRLKHTYYPYLSLICSLLVFINIIVILRYSKSDIFYDEKQITVIKTASELQKYLLHRTQKALERNVPIQIPVTIGLDIYSINISTKNSIHLVGHLWQKFLTGHNPGIRFPRATKTDMQVMYEKKEGNYTIIGWDLNAELEQELDYSKYPFDHFDLEILVQPRITTPSYIFIPDFNHKNFLGEKAHIASFNVVHSFFAYIKQLYQMSEVIDRKVQLSPTGLAYHIRLNRNLINPFLTDLIPLIIIFLTIFIIAWFGNRIEEFVGDDKKEYNRKIMENRLALAGSYTALFFSLIILNSQIRNSVAFDHILYIEYYIFCAYIAILTFELSNLIAPRFGKINSSIIMCFYWPLQTIIWFIFTIITFYNA